MKNKKPLRNKMPLVAAWIDELREAFGAEDIDKCIRAGINGAGTFWASENGIEIGSKKDDGVMVTPVDDWGWRQK